MSKTLKISLGWLLLPLVAWLGLHVYSLAMQPVVEWWSTHGLGAELWLLVALAALGHAALFAWPLAQLYGRAAGPAAFIMIWPVFWQHVPVVFDASAAADLRVLWAVALVFYVLSLFVAVRLVKRMWSPARFRHGPVSVETLIRRHQRAVMQRVSVGGNAQSKRLSSRL